MPNVQPIKPKWTIKRLIDLHDNLICYLKTKDSSSDKTCSTARLGNEAEHKVAGVKVRGNDTAGLETA